MSQGEFETGPGPIDPKGGGGTLRAIGIALVVLGATVVLVCAGGAFWLAQNDSVREGFESIVASRDAPGAEELRGAGCDEAMVMEPQVFAKMAEGLAGALGQQSPFEQSDALDEMPGLFVVCTVTGSSGMTCAEAARVFREATGWDQPFMAQVARGGEEPCQEVYDGQGNLVGDLSEWFEAQDEG